MVWFFLFRVGSMTESQQNQQEKKSKTTFLSFKIIVIDKRLELCEREAPASTYIYNNTHPLLHYPIPTPLCSLVPNPFLFFTSHTTNGRDQIQVQEDLCVLWKQFW